MKDKIIHVKRTIDIELAVPETATKEEIEAVLNTNFLPDGIIKNYDGTYRIHNVSLVEDDDQDSFIVVEWPESQELCMYEGFYENCDFISGDTIEPCSYLVNKNWYGKLINGELQKNAEYQAA